MGSQPTPMKKQEINIALDLDVVAWFTKQTSEDVY
jgi:hypothetical protein